MKLPTLALSLLLVTPIAFSIIEAPASACTWGDRMDPFNRRCRGPIGNTIGLPDGGNGPAQMESNRPRPSAPNFGTMTLSPGFLPDPAQVTGRSGGQVRTQDCGYIDTRPDHRLTLTGDFSYLRVHVESQADTTLVIQGPFGRICSDDVNGFNPEIARRFPQGVYDIYVGTFGETANYPYTLFATEYRR